MAERNPELFRFGVFNPKHFIIAVIRDADKAEQAATALRDAGFAADDVWVVPGQTVLDTEREYHDSKGFLARLAGLYPAEEAERVQEDMPEAERGASFVAVIAPEEKQRTVAAGILAAEGGYNMRYYGENTITDL